MQFTEIKVEIPVSQAETAEAIANMTVPYGIYIEDYSDLKEGVMETAHVDLIDEQLLKKDPETAIIHIYINECENPAEAILFLRERLTDLGIENKIILAKTDDSEWSENWKKYFKAFAVGEKLAVCPSWENYENRDGRRVISLDPGAAFGTGGHATTYLCMSLLEKYTQPESRVLDIGTGSGILSISALLLGAESAVGVDIDELSVKTAAENARRNGVAEKCEFIVGDLAEKVKGRYNIVCANIVADVIIRLFDNVADFMEKDAVLLISGIIDMRADEVEAAAAAHGFTVKERLTRDEWHAYALTKQPN